MARSWHALMLTTALVAAVAVRASAQPVPPTPAALPDPVAILLPPVASDTPLPIRSVQSDSALPRSEPAARMRFNQDDFVTVRATDYEQAKKSSTSYADPESARRGTDDPYGYLMNGLNERKQRSAGVWEKDGRPMSEQLGEKIDELLNGAGVKATDDRRRRFESDREFANFVSPVSNPFFAEDPRSLTEIRPIFLYQSIPDKQPSFQGGNSMFLGGQVRLAFTPRVSIVVNKVGASRFDPGSGSSIPGGTGLSELWLGPKVVIVRNPEFQTLVTGGVTFQIPLGSSSVYQNTGSLSIVPYVSGGQKLMSTTWGTFQGMGTAGYAISTNSERSDYFFASAHVDFDINNNHRFYPLTELNWFAYTKDGKSSNLGVEGRDLANFGAASKGANLVTWAIGGRWRSKNTFWEVGAAYEFPLMGPRDLFRNRVTIDFIWRF